MSGALSITASGGALAFTGWDVAGDGRDTSQVVRVMSTTAPAGTVARRSHVVLSRPVSGPELTAVSLSPDGASFYLCTQAGSRIGRITDVARYRASTGEFLQDLASLRGTPAPTGCSMALDASGWFLLVPYSLSPTGLPVLNAARINVRTRAVMTLTIQLPRTAGMGRDGPGDRHEHRLVAEAAQSLIGPGLLSGNVVAALKGERVVRAERQDLHRSG